MERVEISVRGRVQGVAFRWFIRKTAQSLGLSGRVANYPDGSVQIVAEGPRTDLETLCDWALRGPDHARVAGHEISWGPATGQYGEFRITG